MYFIFDEEELLGRVFLMEIINNNFFRIKGFKIDEYVIMQIFDK